MARQQLTNRRELALIRDAERLRDVGDLVPADIVVGEPDTVVLSLRLAGQEVLALRRLAAERGLSLVEFLEASVRQLCAAGEAPGPQGAAPHPMLGSTPPAAQPTPSSTAIARRRPA